MKCSVVVCSHNPKPEYLTRTLEGLRNQSVAYTEWELVLVDSASSPPLGQSFNLDWHPNGRIVRVDQLGVTLARLRGIEVTDGDLVVFVDDDNVLAPTYLEEASYLYISHPHIGAFGGNVTGDFETPPPPFVIPLLGWLAIRTRVHDTWGNSFHHYPVGAGLCVRREVVRCYSDSLKSSPERRTLDRTGEDLISGGDTDIVITALDMGLGIGVFIRLSLVHLIPSKRLTKKYLIKMAEAMAFTPALMSRMGRFPAPPPPSWRRKLLEWARYPFLPSFERALHKAKVRGECRAAKYPLPKQAALSQTTINL